ncbi:UDP-glycosyltransferase 74G1 [Trifolium repens]|nr:UDP-glycosyltransferase 74G1 [Trifolium repens]
MISHIQSFNTSFLTICFSSTKALIPTFQTSTINFALRPWSDQSGIATIGTPKLKASNVEFQPQCVKKHPIDSCARTFNWEHHVTTKPFSDFFSKSFGSLLSSEVLTTHK